MSDAPPGRMVSVAACEGWITMVVPASTTAVRIVAAAVRGMAETVLAPEDADHVEVVTAEVGNNIVTHGLGAGEACCHGESFLLSIMVNPQCVTMEFVDDGPPFDPVSALPGTPEESVARGGGGLGLYIMRRIMDELSYRRVGGSNVFRLVKRGTARVSEEDAQ